MKRIFAIVLLSFAYSSAAAEWVPLDQTVKGKVYVDPKTKKRDGDMVRLWTLFDYIQGQGMMFNGVLVQSVKDQKQFDCKNDTFRMISFVGHPGAMGGDVALLSKDTPNAVWQSVVPETINQIIFDYACSK